MIQLIEGYSDQAADQVEQIADSFVPIKQVAVFFENSNFLITDYEPASFNVHLIVENEQGDQLHIESANCGYGGGGPNATVDILECLGVSREETERYIFYHDAVQFSVDEQGKIIRESVNTSYLFYPNIRENYPNTKQKIRMDDNVSVNLKPKKLMFFNPQYHSWLGVLSMLVDICPTKLEYYFGDNSPLDNYYRVDNKMLRQMGAKVDTRGVKHVNLVIYGERLTAAFLIDDNCAIQVIDSIYLTLTGKTLFPSERYSLSLKKRSRLAQLIKDILPKAAESEIHENILIEMKAVNRRGF